MKERNRRRRTDGRDKNFNYVDYLDGITSERQRSRERRSPHPDAKPLYEMTDFLVQWSKTERPLKVGTHLIPGPEVTRLAVNCADADLQEYFNELSKIRFRTPNRNPFSWWLGGKIRDLPSSSTLGKRKEVPEISEGLCAYAFHPLRNRTPLSFFPTEVPKENLLSYKQLEETFANIVASSPDSVAAQFMDPIELINTGLTVRTRTDNLSDAINYGSVLLDQMRSILTSIQHAESVETMKDWLVSRCRSDEETRSVITFLKILLNYTSILDSDTHIALFSTPDKKEKKRDKEILIAPLVALRACISHMGHEQYLKYKDHPIKEDFRTLASLVRLRFGEVDKDIHRLSIFTAKKEALVPNNQDFARMGYILARGRTDYDRTAHGLIKIAESVGVENTEPLISTFEQEPELKNALEREAKATGLMAVPEVTQKLYDKIYDNPFVDAGDRNWAEIINPNTKQIIIEVLTGTFGPFTVGHADLIRIHAEHIKTLPNDSIQRIILLVPMIDPIGIPGYPKIPSRVGTLSERVKSIILGLSSCDLDQNQIFVTTKLQPKPQIPVSLEDRVEDTINALRAKIFQDLRQASRRASISISHNYFFGPDGIKLIAPDNSILDSKENQPGRVTYPGGTIIVRRGMLHLVMTNLESFRKETGIDYVTLTPGTPYSSSTAAIEDLHQGNYSRFIFPGAQWFVSKHWSSEFINARNIANLTEKYQSVEEYSLALLEEMDDHLRQVS